MAASRERKTGPECPIMGGELTGSIVGEIAHIRPFSARLPTPRPTVVESTKICRAFATKH